jgi:hypothetical protein
MLTNLLSMPKGVISYRLSQSGGPKEWQTNKGAYVAHAHELGGLKSISPMIATWLARPSAAFSMAGLELTTRWPSSRRRGGSL